VLCSVRQGCLKKSNLPCTRDFLILKIQPTDYSISVSESIEKEKQHSSFELKMFCWKEKRMLVRHLSRGVAM